LRHFATYFHARGIDLNERLKLRLLEDDLKRLGMDSTEVERGFSVETPSIEEVSDALGVLYVLEGSTMGGVVISKHLRSLLGEDTPCSYFVPYKDKQMEMWSGFIKALCKDEGDRKDERVIIAACATFLYIEKAFKE